MITFTDGPAAGLLIPLRRAPVFLRVVKGPSKWDALDMPEDAPGAEEEIHVYRRLTAAKDVGTAHIDFRRPRGSVWTRIAEYEYFADQPGDRHTRTTQAWRAWCMSVYARALQAPAGSVS